MQLEDLPPKLQEQAKRKLKIIEDKKSQKYGARKTTIDGITFDSKFESEHYTSLKLLERAKVIKNLKLQPRFLLQEGFVYQGHKERKIEYVADFQYEQDGEVIVEDCKSDATKTQVYMLKRKLFLYKYGNEVKFREVFNETNKS